MSYLPYFLLILVGLTAASTVLQLRWTDNEGFVTNATVGTPPQKLVLGVRNEDSSLYVHSTACLTCSNSSAARFDPSASRTLLHTGQEFYCHDPDGQAIGEFALDQLYLSGHGLGRLRFGLATSQARNVDPRFRIRGRISGGGLGLGPRPGIHDGFHPYSLYDAVGAPNVTFRVDESGNAGQVLLGPQANSICSPEYELIKQTLRNMRPNTYMPVYASVVELKSIEVSGRPISNNLPAVFSLNSERWEVRDLNILVKSFRASGSNHTVECNGPFPKINIIIDGRAFPVPGEALVKKVDNDTCVLNAVAIGRYRLVVIGKSFFQHYCVSYDHNKNRVGISQAL